MLALRKLSRGPGHLELVELDRPSIADGEVLVRVSHAAICATDVHLLHDTFPNSPPFTLGHEFSGVVEETGASVATARPGDRVVSANNPCACGECRVCRKGFPNLCPSKRAMGIHSDGAFAEYIGLPAHLLYVVPDHVPLSAAALMEPLAVAVHAVSEPSHVEAGDVVVVVGCGAIGILAAQASRALGARVVLIAGTSADEGTRFELARALDLETINVESASLAKRIAELTDGVGADLVVEASGSAAALTGLHALPRRAGRVSLVGITGRDTVPIPWDAWIGKGLTCHFSYGSVGRDWETGLDLLARGTVATEPLISKRYPLEEWERAFRKTELREVVRGMFDMGGVDD